MWQNKFTKYGANQWVKVFVVAVIYYLLAKVSFVYDFNHSGYSPIWLPGGFALAVIFMGEEILALGISLGALLAYISVFGKGGLVGVPLWGVAASLAFINALQALIGRQLLKRFLSRPYPLFKVSDVLIFVGIAALVAGIGTVIGTQFLCAYGIAPWEFYDSIIYNWWWSEVSGILIVAPIVWILKEVPLRFEKPWYKFEAAAWLIALTLIAWVVFSGIIRVSTAHMPISFLLLPLMVWSTYRLGHWAAMISVLIMVITSVWGTAQGHGPFVLQDLESSLLLMRSFNAVGAVTALTLAAALFERQQAQRELARSHQRFKALIENSLDVVKLLSAEGLILFTSNSVVRLTGYTPDEYVGRSIFEFIYPDDQQLVQEKFVQVLKSSGSMVSAQCRMICKNGAVRWYEGTGQNLLADPAVKAIVVNFYDITERKLVEDILKMDRLSLQQLVEERSQALAESQKELKQASRLADIGTLAATVAHELRNPLGVIQIAAHNLKRKNKQLSQDQHLNNIEKKVWEGNQIIDNLLSYSRIKMPSFQAVNVIEIMEECLHHAQGRFASQAVQIIRVYNAQEACIIEADPNQLREIFVNVLNNAFQSMIGLFHGHIEVRIEAGDTVMFTIQDSGIGIDSDDLMKVFNPFFTRKAKGTGLGLTICNEIVNLHHGRIEITSQKNSGTSVCITLPVTHAHSLLK